MRTLTAIRARRQPGMTRLVLDGEPWLSASVDLVVREGLRAGLALDAGRVAAVEAAVREEQAWFRVVRLVAIRARTARELAAALRARGVEADVVVRAVARAEARGLVQEDEAARLIVRRARARGEAAPVIAGRLAAAGVDRERARELLAELGADHQLLQDARDWVRRRVGPVEAMDTADYAAIARRLGARGHSQADVVRILGAPPPWACSDPDALASELARRFPGAATDPQARRRARAWCARRRIPGHQAMELVMASPSAD